MDGVTRRMLCTWQVLGLAVKDPWLAASGPIPILDAGTGVSESHSHILGGSFPAGKAVWALSRYLPIENADYCMLVNERAWSRSSVC